MSSSNPIDLDDFVTDEEAQICEEPQTNEILTSAAVGRITRAENNHSGNAPDPPAVHRQEEAQQETQHFQRAQPVHKDQIREVSTIPIVSAVAVEDSFQGGEEAEQLRRQLEERDQRLEEERQRRKRLERQLAAVNQLNDQELSTPIDAVQSPMNYPWESVADTVYQCKLIRRATPRNCPWVVNRPRKDPTFSQRYRYDVSPVDTTVGAPSKAYIAEIYVITLSKLANCGELKHHLHEVSGIPPVKSLRICRSEVIVNEAVSDEQSCLKTFTKIIPLTDKDPVVSQMRQRRVGPTQIVAFETTVNPRRLGANATMDLHLHAYGDKFEARIVDTDPLAIAKAMSRSLWPTNASDLKVGLRVDAEDMSGTFLRGTVVAVKEQYVEGGDTDTVAAVVVERTVQVHFDDFITSRWDELYKFDAFQNGKLLPLYAKTEPKHQIAEYTVFHRYIDRKSQDVLYFGLSFLLQIHTEWSTARAGAHILLQAARFLDRSSHGSLHCIVSNFIDLLVDIDRQYIHQCLDVSPKVHGNGSRPYRYQAFQSERFVAEAEKKIAKFTKKLPFQLVVGYGYDLNNKRYRSEKIYSYAVHVNVGNFVNSNHALILNWREPSDSIKREFNIGVVDRVLYSHPRIHQDT